MANLTTVSIAFLIAVGGMLTEVATDLSIDMKLRKGPIEISYEDLTPQAQTQVSCLANNVYFEAGNQSLDGKKAVALVTMNRVSSKKFPSTICGVVKQKTRSICQFSWWCDSKMKKDYTRRDVDVETFQQSEIVALEVYMNYHTMEDITDGALFYHADYVAFEKLGLRKLVRTVKIGRHIFYRTNT